MKKMINKKTLALISVLLFLPLLVGCFLLPLKNQAPVITSTPVTGATVGQVYTYDVNATDPDSGDTLTYSLTTSPTGMTIDSATGVISWTPTSAQIGDNPVIVEVSDGELSDTQSFIIVVSAAPPVTLPSVPPVIPDTGNISGTVISDASGPAVEGSTVTVVGTTLIATTDAAGNYAMSGVPVGTYNVIVTQSGRTTCKAQNITIIKDQTTLVDFIQKRVNVPEWETNPPTISVAGIADGDTMSGTVNYLVQVADESDVFVIYVGYGYMPCALQRDERIIDSNSLLAHWDTIEFPNGQTQLVVVAYDANYNRSQLALNVTIDNPIAVGTLPAAPTSLWPLSITFGEKLGYFVEERNKLFEKLGIEGDANIITLSRDKKIDLNAVINTAGPDSNLYVDLDWDEVEGALGYRIYRSFDESGPFRLIGTNFGVSNKYFNDASPILSIGKKTYYKVSAYNTAGEGEKSTAEWTTPLTKFNLNLVSPADGATGVSLTPTLEWQPVEVVGNYQEYDFYVMGKNDEDVSWDNYIFNETSVLYNGDPLQYLKVYEWNVYWAVAYDDFYSEFPWYRAVSIAGLLNGSLNGAFEFTTQSE